MNNQIRQIAERLRGLREVLELTTQEIADTCEIPVDEYRLAESGEADISVSLLQKIARQYDISLDALMFGEEPKMSSYFLTRAGMGVSIERTQAYKYQLMNFGCMLYTAFRLHHNYSLLNNRTVANLLCSNLSFLISGWHNHEVHRHSHNAYNFSLRLSIYHCRIYLGCLYLP